MLCAQQVDDFLQINCVHLIKVRCAVTVDIQNKFCLFAVHERHDDFRFGQAAAGNVARKLIDIRYNHGLLAPRRRTANAFGKGNRDASERSLRIV